MQLGFKKMNTIYEEEKKGRSLQHCYYERCHVPKLVGVCKDLHGALALGGAFMQHQAIIVIVSSISLCLAFPSCSNQDLDHGGQRASTRLLVSVQGCTEYEHNDGEDHHRCWNSESPSKANVVLHTSHRQAQV